VVSKAGELIGSGANDVPQARGGLYWGRRLRGLAEGRCRSR